MSTQGTMKQKLTALMNKRNIELPLAKQRVQEEFEKLKRLSADIAKEETEVEREISELLGKMSLAGNIHSNKSILDLPLPQVMWRKIPTYFKGREYCLLNACLSSPSLEHLITNGLSTTKLRLLGEKVFSILILRYYVSKQDLRNCLNTTCQDLQFFAGSSWWCFQKSISFGMGSLCYRPIRFRNRDEIKEFSQRAAQARNKWDLFNDLYLMFFCHLTGTRSEYDKFCKASISLQKRFGEYISYVQWDDSFPGNQPLHDICPELHIILPRLKQVKWTLDTNFGPHHLLSSQLNDRTVEPCFTLSGNLYVPKIISVDPSEGNFYGCTINSPQLKNAVQLVSSKQLTIDMSWSNVVENYNNVLGADLSIFFTVRSLVVRGDMNHLGSIVMLEKFPNVTEVALMVREIIDPPITPADLDQTYPRIKKLTFGIINLPPRLDIVPRHFPLLRYLTIKDNAFLGGFKDMMSKSRREGHFDDGVIDVYRLYSENRSLKESNIWSEMPHLTTLCIDIHEIFGKSGHLVGADENCKVYTRRQEIYRRTETGRILSDITCSVME